MNIDRSIDNAKASVKRLLETSNISYIVHLEHKFDVNDTISIQATFSKPCKEFPIPDAVVHVEFLFDKKLNVNSYCIEGERHQYNLKDNIDLNERLLDKVIKRKLLLKHTIDLNDEFTCNRINKTTKYTTENELFSLMEKEDFKLTKYLNYTKFAKILRETDLHISKMEKELLFAFAFEDDFESINYNDFIHRSIKIINHFQEIKDERLEEKNEIMKIAYKKIAEIELEDTLNLFGQLLQAADYLPPHIDRNSRIPVLSRKVFRRCLLMPLLNLANEEINLILANASVNENGKIIYSNYRQIFLNARYLIGIHQAKIKKIMDIHLRSILENEYQLTHASYGDNKLPRRTIIAAIQSNNIFMLSPIQILQLVSQATADAQQNVDYKDFLNLIIASLERILDEKNIKLKANLIQKAEEHFSKQFPNRNKEDIENSLLKQFKKFDLDGNGVLDLNEFTLCLKSATELQLTNDKLQWFVALADVNGDEVIDYEEFTRVAYHHFRHMYREKILESLLSQE